MKTTTFYSIPGQYRTAVLAALALGGSVGGYALTNLGEVNITTNVNDSKMAVGQIGTPAGDGKAYLYSGGVLTNLGSLPGGLHEQSIASDINSPGLVVGTSGQRAFSYSGGVMTSLGLLPGANTLNGHSTADGVNNLGQIVGSSSFAGGGGSYHAYLYSGGTMTDIGTLGGFSRAYSINDSGQIVGQSLTATNQFQAFLYSGGSMVNLGALGGFTGSAASDINDFGQVVGNASSLGGSYAFLYSGGVFTNLGTLGGVGTTSHASSINDSGQVVGHNLFADGSLRAFLYEAGVMNDLNVLCSDLLAHWGTSAGFVRLYEATGISDNGLVTGQGLYFDGTTYSEQAFLLDLRTDQLHVPDGAATLSLLAVAMTSLAVFRRRLAS